MIVGQEILTNAEPVWSRNLDKNAFIGYRSWLWWESE